MNAGVPSELIERHCTMTVHAGPSVVDSDAEDDMDWLLSQGDFKTKIKRMRETGTKLDGKTASKEPKSNLARIVVT